jgi:lipid-binding SYLF domain-containing protein
MRVVKNVLPCLLTSLFLLVLAAPVWAADKNSDDESIRNATTVLRAMMESKDVPASVVSKADCIIVLPSVKKFAVGVGGSGGRGPMSCRLGKDFNGKWSAPAMYSVGGASAGFQIGGSSTDYVLLIMAPKAVDTVIKSKVKVGTDVTAAAGPSGATVGSTKGGEDILSYARTKGLFAGVSLAGSSLDPDSDANQRLYGGPTTVETIVRENTVKITPAGQAFTNLLNSSTKK